MWTNSVLSGFMLLAGVELLSVIPFIFISGVFYLMVNKKDYKVLAIVTCLLMAFLNFGASDIDVLLWVLNIILVLI